MARWALIATLLFASASGEALAADDTPFPEDAPRVYAIEERPYQLGHELSLNVGVLPLDAFYVGLTLGGAYTLHFTDLWAWEVLSASYSFNVDTSLEGNLEDDFDVLPVDGGEERITVFATSNFVVKPLFGKLAMFNRSVIYAEALVVLGGGTVRHGGSWHGAIDAGIALRLFADDTLSFRFDLRDYVFFPGDEVENALLVGIGTSLSFGGGGGR